MVHTSTTTEAQQHGKAVVEHPDDIVISGMSIRCSQSENVEEFADNLYSGVNMVHENLQRCDEDHFGVPKQHGFIKDIRKFDATFFNVHPKQAEGMDPQLRILHEVSYESLIDAGVDPKELKNSNTGVFIGTSNSDAREAWTSVDVSEIDGYSLIGTHRAFLANRLSFTFDLRGPSFGVDAACATTGVAINQGYLHVKNGVCNAALVGGVSLVYQPKVSYQILKLGLLCKDGMCKVFDEAADGYVRAEAIVCLFLQKRKDARRIYATLVHSKINNDGFKEQGITFPCTESQGQLVAEVYAEAGVDPEDVEYVEAHGTGTTIGDPQETNGIALGFAGSRTKPLPIGAVKSNMGHSEHASGGVSLVKILISMQTGVIPANLHYKTPNPLIPALVDGRLKVVTENMKWNSTLAGLNCFGFGGQNSHLIVRGNPNVRKEKVTDTRLFVYMGRTAEAAQNAMDYVNRYPDNPHVPYLLMQSAYAKPASMPFRGYTILNSGQKISAVDRVAVEQKPVWWIFSGQGTQWAAMGKDMMKLDAFAAIIKECAEALVPHGLDLVKILTDAKDEDYSDCTISFVGIAAIQVALVELLRVMEISPQGFVGHSAGEIGCAYADGCFDAKEAILAAYWRGRAVKEAKLLPGAMAAVGLTWKDATELCKKYKDVTPACDNAGDNVTVSGSAAEVSRLVADMKPLNIFAKEVNSYGVAFHSPAMQTAAPIYLEALKKVLPNPKQRTGRWLSTAFDEADWTSNVAKFASAEYFAKNLTSPVQFDHALKKVPANAIVIEIAPHGLLQALIRKTVGDRSSQVALMKKGVPDNLTHFLESIGKLYVMGLNPIVTKIFPKPSLPAPRDTPFVGSVVQWDHSASWRIPHFTDFIHKGGKSAQHSNTLDLSDPLNQYYLDNVVDGQPRLSAGGAIAMVAKAYAVDTGNTVEKSPQLIFSEVQFLAPVILDKNHNPQFSISIARLTGYFEIVVESEVVVTGYVSTLTGNTAVGDSTHVLNKQQPLLDAHVTYEELAFRGYSYGPQAKLLTSTTADGVSGIIQAQSYESAIDGLLQLVALSNAQRGLVVPRKIRSIKVNMPVAASSARSGCTATILTNLDLALTTGVEIEGVQWEYLTQEPSGTDQGGLSQVRFVPFETTTKQVNGETRMTPDQTMASLIELAVENSPETVKVVELLKGTKGTSAGGILHTCQLPTGSKLQFNSFVLKSEQNTEIEQGSATVLILQDYFTTAASDLTKQLQAVSSLIQDDGLLIVRQQLSGTKSDTIKQVFSGASGFSVVAEVLDQDNYFRLSRKVSDETAQKSTRSVIALVKGATDEENSQIIRKTATEAHAAGESSSRVWIVSTTHSPALNDTILHLNREFPDAGLRLIVDSTETNQLPAFNATNPAYTGVVTRDLVINVFKNGVWGTYRSVPVAQTTPEHKAKTTTDSSHLIQAALSKATRGQTILVNADKVHAKVEDIVKVASKLGLVVHVVSQVATDNGHTYHGSLSNFAVAQKVLAATSGLGVNIVYNLADTSVLRDSLRVLSTNGSYIEGKATTSTDASCLSSAMAKGVSVHTLATDAIVIRPASGIFHSKKDFFVVAGTEAEVGVKVAYWLAAHGADKIHLHLSLPTTPAVQGQVRYFEKLGSQLTVSSSGTTTEQILSSSITVGGIFVVDSIKTGTEKSHPLNTVALVDKLTVSTPLDHFVVLTSNSSSSLAKLVERRSNAGLSGVLLEVPALAFSTESIHSHHEANAEHNFVSIHRALDALETALDLGDRGVFVVVPERKASAGSALSSLDDETGPQDKSYLPQAVAKIMGIKDFASLDMFLSLGDYGIDSLMAMELGRILERDFNLSLTLQEIRSLCIRDICLMSGATNAVEASKLQLSDVRSEFEKPVLLETASKHYNLNEIVPKAAIVQLRHVPETAEILFIVHPMEGAVSPVLETLANHLQVTTYGLNCTGQCDTKTMTALAASYLKEIKKIQPTGPYNIGGYSFGAGVAFEMALQLQKEDEKSVRNLILLDGSHSFVATFTKSMKSGYTVNPNMPPEEMEARKQSAFDTAILTLFVTQLVKTKRKQLTDMLSAAPTFQEKVDVTVKELQRCDGLQALGKDALQAATIAFAQRLKIADVYRPQAKYTGRTTLIKCSEKMMRNLGEFYELDKVCTQKDLIHTATVPGNHEGFVLGESARVTAKHVNDALLARN